MKKLTFADGSVGYRDKETWLELEGVPVVSAEASGDGLEAISPAPIEPINDKQYDDTKPIKDNNATDSSGSLPEPTGRV